MNVIYSVRKKGDDKGKLPIYDRNGIQGFLSRSLCPEAIGYSSGRRETRQGFHPRADGHTWQSVHAQIV